MVSNVVVSISFIIMKMRENRNTFLINVFYVEENIKENGNNVVDVLRNLWNVQAILR